MAELKYVDEDYNANWRLLISVFKKITDGNPPIEKVREKLVSLQTKAKNTIPLTQRQIEGIYSRCSNYLNGTYGKDAVKDLYKAPTN